MSSIKNITVTESGSWIIPNDTILPPKSVIPDNSVFGDNCTVGHSSKIGNNCKFGWHNIIKGRSRIGDNCSANWLEVQKRCRVGKNLTVKNLIADNECTFGDNCVVLSCANIGSECVFGKNCRLPIDAKFDIICKFGEGFKFGDHVALDWVIIRSIAGEAAPLTIVKYEHSIVVHSSCYNVVRLDTDKEIYGFDGDVVDYITLLKQNNKLKFAAYIEAVVSVMREQNFQ